jgi:hypothetical protein
MAKTTQKFPTLARWQGFLRDRAASFWAYDALYGMQASDKYISSTEVLALQTTGINVVAAPGPGKYLMFMGATVFMDYNSAAYTGGGGRDIVFTYTDKSGAAVSHTLDDTLFAGQTADVVAYAYPLNAAASTLAAAANAPIVISIASSNWTVGDSPLKVRTFYRVLDRTELEGIAA